MIKSTSLRRVFALGVAVLAGSGALVGFTATSATAEELHCAGDGTWVSDITRVDDPGGGFTIQLRPAQAARDFSRQGDQRPLVVLEWHEIQACVPGLSGSLADSIWQQLECHQKLAWVIDPRTNYWYTGDTYGLDSAAPALPRFWFGEAGDVAEKIAQCGNDLAGNNPAGLDPALLAQIGNSGDVG